VIEITAVFRHTDETYISAETPNAEIRYRRDSGGQGGGEIRNTLPLWLLLFSARC
jgi:hypothetical protein